MTSPGGNCGPKTDVAPQHPGTRLGVALPEVERKRHDVKSKRGSDISIQDISIQSDISVLFIGGHSRSGSTLLSRLLGQQPAMVSVGELTFIASRGYRDNQLCSCGKPFAECPFWKEVVARVGGTKPDDWFARLETLRQSVDRIRYTPLLALGARSPGLPPLGKDTTARSSEYSGMLGALLHVIADVAEVNVVVDSSKEPPYGFLLNGCEAIDLYPVHLVRDCRAVAFSQQQVKVRPEIHWTTEHMPRFSPAKSAVDWMLSNTLMHLLGRTTGRYRRVKYEDIALDHQAVSKTLLEWVAPNSTSTPADPPASAGVGEHELSGNPMRFKPDFKIELDVQWLEKMSPRDKLVATSISAPLLRAYGYV
jgi:hypothetical protein